MANPIFREGTCEPSVKDEGQNKWEREENPVKIREGYMHEMSNPLARKKEIKYMVKFFLGEIGHILSFRPFKALRLSSNSHNVHCVWVIPKAQEIFVTKIPAKMG
uniref:Uncharacterized protein n=1 Tax=Micrurus corallinus TaxID=54390 RepID=A0A2D4GBV9_MICCO